MARAIVSRCRFRRSLQWWFAAVLLAVFVLGCQGGDSRELVEGSSVGDGEVLAAGSSAGDTETSPSVPKDGKVRVLDSPVDDVETVQSGPGTGDDSGGAERPVGPGDGPGSGPGGPLGPVDDTGDDSGGGPGVGPGEGDLAGGLRLMAPRPPYEGVVDDVYDLCDDHSAFVVMFGRALEPGEEMTDEQRHEIALDRVINEVSCDEPGGRRYVFLGDYGAPAILDSPEAAIADYSERTPYLEENRIQYPKDIPLGYYGHLDWTFPLEDIDEIRVVPGSVLVRDGVVRGLVRNFSKTLFGREVTVTVSAGEGNEGVNNDAQPASGRFALTVQPGERAPFEILGWAGSADPADFVLAVTADMSTRVDITRSFSFGTGGSVTTRTLDEEFFKNFVPDFVYQAEKHKIDEDGSLMIEYISVGLTAPTSHPSLEDRVLSQTIEDLRLYMALIGNGKIYDVVEPPLYRGLSEPVHPRHYPQVVRQPTIINGHPRYGFAVTFIPEYSWHMWVGEPGPLDYNPRSLVDPEPPTWDYPTQQPSSPTTSAPADGL